MKLNKLRFWEKSELIETPQSQQIQQSATPPSIGDSVSNVVQLPVATPLSQPAGLDQPNSNDAQVGAPQPVGLMDSPELRAFLFDQKHFGLGKHNGAYASTQASLELGKRNIISEFQNILNEQVERKKVKYQALQLKYLETVGFDDVTSSMLDFAKQRVQSDIDVLREQIALAEDQRGWVLRALNLYQTGFGQGVRAAIQFEQI